MKWVSSSRPGDRALTVALKTLKMFSNDEKKMLCEREDLVRDSRLQAATVHDAMLKLTPLFFLVMDRGCSCAPSHPAQWSFGAILTCSTIFVCISFGDPHNLLRARRGDEQAGTFISPARHQPTRCPITPRPVSGRHAGDGVIGETNGLSRQIVRIAPQLAI